MESVENESSSMTVDEQVIETQTTASDETMTNVDSDEGEKKLSDIPCCISEPPIQQSSIDDSVPITCSASSSSHILDEERPNSIYHIKWISHNNQKTPIVTQNENGPCPLIAIINVLILKGRVKLPQTVDIVTSEKLMQHLSECILDSIPKNLPEGTQLNYEQNIHDAMSVLPKLQTGLDVNVKFTGIGDFEYTPECIIFDLLRIPLYHGWLIEPEMIDVKRVVGTHSYNQLVEKIIDCKTSSDADKAAEALVAENFLEKTASQLTYHGLCELTSSLLQDELCILFRNNHFTSLVKHNNLLYQLVTDQGFLNENVVWESLNSIEGDSQFVDHNFVLVPPKTDSPIALPTNVVPVEKQIDQDYLVALSLEEEQKKQQQTEMEWENFKQNSMNYSLADEELARRLQQEERRTAPVAEPMPTNSNSNNQSERNKSRDCIIL